MVWFCLCWSGEEDLFCFLGVVYLEEVGLSKLDWFCFGFLGRNVFFFFLLYGFFLLVEEKLCRLGFGFKEESIEGII